VQQRRLQREGENPVPHYWAHVHWAFGATNMADFLVKSQAMTLEGHLQHIRVPFLVTHGAKDRQIPPNHAQQTFDQLVNSPKRELKFFTAREGGVEHVGADNMSFAREYIGDWFAEQLGGHNG
jgi:esterase/lipase